MNKKTIAAMIAAAVISTAQISYAASSFDFTSVPKDLQAVVESWEGTVEGLKLDALLDIQHEANRKLGYTKAALSLSNIQHKKNPECYVVPTGLWIVGEDIPAGRYEIKPLAGSYATVVYTDHVDKPNARNKKTWKTSPTYSGLRDQYYLVDSQSPVTAYSGSTSSVKGFGESFVIDIVYGCYLSVNDQYTSALNIPALFYPIEDTDEHTYTFGDGDTIPKGIYLVGEDIAPGTWTIKPKEGKKASIGFANKMSDHSGTMYASPEGGNGFLEKTICDKESRYYKKGAATAIEIDMYKGYYLFVYGEDVILSAKVQKKTKK